MTGDEMERAIEFLLQQQSVFDGRIAETNAHIERTQGQVTELVSAVAEFNRVVQLQSETQNELNQAMTRAITDLAESHERLAEAQAATEWKLNALLDVVRDMKDGA